MATQDGSQKSQGNRRAFEPGSTRDIPIEIKSLSSDTANIVTHIPSPPPSGSPKIATYVASLSAEQRNAVSDFISATKEPVSIAVQALYEAEWDLLDAISQFGEDVDPDENVDPSTPAIESIRPRSTPNPAKRFGETNSPPLLRQALVNITRKNGKDLPGSLRSIIFDPVSLDYSLLTSDTQSIPAFISPYDEKMWYTGFMRPWEGFKDAVLDNWLNQSYTDIFKEVQGTRGSGHFFNKKITVVRDDAELFESDFEDDVLLPALSVMDRLLITESLKRLTRTRGCLMANAEEEDIATEDCVWAPRYVFRFNNFGERRETRLIGHVEFLAGRPGALSEAYELRKTAKWGSLRCVLGDIVQWMLMNDHRYSFLVSTDEIMFLRMDIKAVKVNDRNNNLQPKTVLYEPWLHYSVPMKIADAFDYGKNTITTRMGIFHLLWLVIQDDRKWRLPAETGNCLNYATFTGDEEDLIPRRTCVPGPCVAK